MIPAQQHNDPMPARPGYSVASEDEQQLLIEYAEDSDEKLAEVLALVRELSAGLRRKRVRSVAVLLAGMVLGYLIGCL